MTRGVLLISSNFLQKNYKTHELPKLCTFDFIQFCTVHVISILIPFLYTLSSLHSHIHILIQSTIHKRIKKLFTVRFVGNSSSFFLLLFVGEVDSIEIFKFWIELTRLWIIFSGFGPIKKKKIPEPAWTRPDRHYPRPSGLTIHYAGCGSWFSNPFTAGRVAGNMQIRPAPTPYRCTWLFLNLS